MWSRNSFSLARNSCSCGEIIATGADAAASAAGACTGASAGRLRFFDVARCGAMIAFSTLLELHAGQVTSLRLACLS
jgi:hypothetical protein